MGPRIADMGELRIVGCAEKGADIGALWARFEEAAEQIGNRVEGVGYELHSWPEGEHDWDDMTVMVGVEVTEVRDVPDGMSVRMLPAARYAVFTHRLGDGGYEGANEAMDAWLESGPYSLAENLSIQRYDSRFKGGGNPDSEIDFLLPIVSKD
jgi:AraC family transcriptional regulator